VKEIQILSPGKRNPDFFHRVKEIPISSDIQISERLAAEAVACKPGIAMKRKSQLSNRVNMLIA